MNDETVTSDDDEDDCPDCDERARASVEEFLSAPPPVLPKPEPPGS